MPFIDCSLLNFLTPPAVAFGSVASANSTDKLNISISYWKSCCGRASQSPLAEPFSCVSNNNFLLAMAFSRFFCHGQEQHRCLSESTIGISVFQIVEKNSSYHTSESTWTKMLDEADRCAQLHLKIRDNLMQDPYEKVNSQLNLFYSNILRLCSMLF